MSSKYEPGAMDAGQPQPHDAELTLNVELHTYWLNGRYIYRSDQPGKILGRASGNIPGGYWYQLAAKRYDEIEVGGIDTLEAAFQAAVVVLEERRIARLATVVAQETTVPFYGR
jgi:hypothetical protein